MSASGAFHDTFGQYDPSEQVRSFGGHVPAAPAAVPGARQAPLRLTRRGRFVFFGLPLILLAALILSFSGFLNAPAKAADSASELSLTPTTVTACSIGPWYCTQAPSKLSHAPGGWYRQSKLTQAITGWFWRTAR